MLLADSELNLFEEVFKHENESDGKGCGFECGFLLHFRVGFEFPEHVWDLRENILPEKTC
jgi:hypothetical protein